MNNGRLDEYQEQIKSIGAILQSMSTLVEEKSVCQLIIIGASRPGKSTFINALLDESLLSAQNAPATKIDC
jgi:predicted GTPase